MMEDETAGDTLFLFGNDLEGKGVGPAGNGILPIISTLKTVEIDSQILKLIIDSRYKYSFKDSLLRLFCQ
ncbi:MAG: hypothetical protein MZV64_53235 [Ignavibacteriales bacterium]|nr:hypothetical protein [Ignavibacteriales bacterium]